MSSVEQSKVTTIRHEYRVPYNPANWGDVQEAMTFAARDRQDKGLTTDYDDVIQVKADDDGITVYWEEIAGDQ